MSKTSKFHLTEPRPEVEIHLPDGRVLSGPRGAQVGDFLEAVADSFEVPVVAAIVNGDLRELTYPVRFESTVRPVDMSEPDGARIYRRSLTFLLEMAFSDLYPKGTLTIDHSVSFGGYYCQVSGRQALTESEIEALKVHMQELVDADLPFERKEVPLAEAIAYFEREGYDDKLHLLSHRRKDYLTLYRLGERMDYHHGYMVPSTGYLRWFDFDFTHGGFTLRFPRRHAPTKLLEKYHYPKLLDAFRQYGDWLIRLGIDNVGALNDAIQAGRGHEIILVSEALHEQHISEIARQIAERQKEPALVLVAGPSSSGKTTFSRRLTVQLLARGISPYPLELDNYFVDREKSPRDENGNFNFEAIETLDLPLLADHLLQLVAGKKVDMPHYNFVTGLREPGETVQLQRGQIIILEGIHGLNPHLIPETLGGRAFRVYVSALTQINLDRHNRVSTTDTRLIRRIVRDARERGYVAGETISGWESVRRGEKRYIFPYQENADVMFNSALVFELAALKSLVEPLLRQVPHGTSEYIEAKRLLAFLEWFLPIDIDPVPENSIAREFLGGSILKDFRLWKGKSR
jgi:uridine kinase